MTKNSFWYRFFKILCLMPTFWCFYRKVKVVGVKNIPKEGPYFFALTHQNSLMDALAVVNTQKQQPVFVARADIFKKKTIVDIFHFLRILPIVRKRDKGKLTDNNEEVYHILNEVLKQKGVVGIMPEGTAKDDRNLLPLQKGIFRIAMKAQAEICAENKNTDIKIVPVGLNWEDTTKFYKNLTVVYGEPMNCKDYYALYQQDNAKAFNQMQSELTQRMRETIDDKYFPVRAKSKDIVHSTFYILHSTFYILHFSTAAGCRFWRSHWRVAVVVGTQIAKHHQRPAVPAVDFLCCFIALPNAHSFFATCYDCYFEHCFFVESNFYYSDLFSDDVVVADFGKMYV